MCIEESEILRFNIGGFWGVDKYMSELYDELGVSLIFIRNKKGLDLVTNISNEIEATEISYEMAVRVNSSEYRSEEKPNNRDEFFKDACTLRYDELIKKYISYSKLFILKAKLKRNKLVKWIRKWRVCLLERCYN